MKKPIPFGKYYLLERINVGGMAEVFRAKAYGVEGFERLVAVKRILPNIAEDKEFIKMFIDEAKISVQLNHANIAQIFDLGMVESAYYIALEHIHGRDLRAIFDRCRNHGEPMPVAQACFAVMKVCEGLDYAHNKRDAGGNELHLVHRDVSPQNILVSFEGEVKIIDFGIAKAAGKGSKTQAGILKGKFGYMSPEQVRGLPIDRRSDIFACGIVLYELLTGERLFVGESDFSTLEKVRNVEILPPSTYNRKIPDELERIVLKALAKDVDDRYQNAIDLHDELQAFVYTAGEFYSRKDLAVWMKRVFAKEIEEESAKLESYRNIRPPEVRGASQGRQRKVTRPDSPKATLALPTVAPPNRTPPPIPRGGNGHHSPAPVALAASGNGAAGADGGLEWDDDELETQIYDNVEDALQAGVSPAPRPAAGAPMAAAGGMEVHGSSPPPEPDLSSLVQTSKGWQSPPSATAEGSPPSPLPTPLAHGSSNTPSPFAGQTAESPPAVADTRDPSAVVRLVQQAEPIFESAFGDAQMAPLVSPPPRTGLYIAIVLAALIVIGGGLGVFLFLDSRSDGDNATAAGVTGTDKTDGANAGTDIAAPTAPGVDRGTPGATGLSAEVLGKTGFDLFVEPMSIRDKVTVKLDGKLVNTAPPTRFRKLAPGDHKVEITAPAGFFSKNETVTVAAGEAGRITIKLDAVEVTGNFGSTPPGAEVTLISGGKKIPLGKTPTSAKLNPTKRYEVQFVKRGYVQQTRPIDFTGRSAETIAAVLERTQVASRPPRDKRRNPSGDLPRVKKPRDKVVKPPKDKVVKPPKDKIVKKPAGKGILMLGSKPPCKIYIDGRNTGKKTPERALSLKAGRHKITLINNDKNIKETFSVTIKPGQKTKVIKNLMKR